VRRLEQRRKVRKAGEFRREPDVEGKNCACIQMETFQMDLKKTSSSMMCGGVGRKN
jgi:hypothetical protein